MIRRSVGRTRRKSLHSGRRLFAFDREIGCRYVAGADEAGRGSLAGPLVAAAVLFDLERLTLSARRSLARLNDSKQHDAEARDVAGLAAIARPRGTRAPAGASALSWLRRWRQPASRPCVSANARACEAGRNA